MNDETRKYLFDINQACLDIAAFTEAISYEDFINDTKTLKAVEREFEIIGEALNRIYRSESEVLNRITNAHKIIGLRNILAHGYDVVDERILWKAIKNHIPLLKSEVLLLL